MNLAHLLLPARGRLSPGDIALLARLGELLPESYRVGHVHPSRGEQRALPRFEAISERSWSLARRRAPRQQALICGRLPGLGRQGQTELESALHSCRLLIVLEARPATLESSRLLGELPVSAGYLRLYRGDFSDPLLRVDDYPTGVRPILDDLSSIHDVLSLIDEAKLPFHLGVVPALLEPRMLPFLRSLSHLIVSMHGFEHGYAKHSKILRDAGDPHNQRGTVGGFDEFAGQSYAAILEQLRAGRRILEERLGQIPASYIPPCNESNRNTGRALVATGFEYLLTEKPVSGCELPAIGSDFYDRSSAFRAGSAPQVASLHVTWEADLRRAGDSQSLPAFLKALVEQRTRTREELATLAERIVSTLGRG